MADKSISVSVRTNIDALDERRIHNALVDLVKHTVGGATDFLHADREAHSRSDLTVEHIRSRVEEIAEMVEGKLGITPVTEKDVRPTHGLFKHSQAPIFIDQGTRSPIFPARSPSMWNRAEGIYGRLFVRGQPAQHFMAKTYAEAQLLLRSDRSLADALAEMNAVAAVEKAEIEST